MRINLVHKTSEHQKYVEKLKLEKVELCKVVEGETDQLLLKLAIDYLRSYFDVGIICKSIGRVHLNFTYVDSPFMKLFPGGYYITNILFSDSKDPNILNITYWSLVTR